MRTIAPEDLGIKERHGLLLSSIGPRPIAWVSTRDKDGNPNLAPFSFFNIFSSNPPVLIFSPARSGRTNTTKHTLDNVITHPEVVINILDHSLLDRMLISSLEYERGVNEFEKAGLSMIDGERVAVPRVAEAPVQLECEVNEVRALGSEGAAGNLVICTVKLIHVAERILNEAGQIDQEKLELVGRMGGAWYSKGYGDSIFELKSNPQVTVVGFDAIPEFARSSAGLNGAQLSQLAMQTSLPDETEVNDFKLEELYELFMNLESEPEKLQTSLVDRCASHLETGCIPDAWKTLLAYNP